MRAAWTRRDREREEGFSINRSVVFGWKDVCRVKSSPSSARLMALGFVFCNHYKFPRVEKQASSLSGSEMNLYFH